MERILEMLIYIQRIMTEKKVEKGGGCILTRSLVHKFCAQVWFLGVACRDPAPTQVPRLAAPLAFALAWSRLIHHLTSVWLSLEPIGACSTFIAACCQC